MTRLARRRQQSARKTETDGMAAEIIVDPPPTANERVVKNAFIYLMGQLLTWSATFFYVSIVPRHLGEAGMGRLTLTGTTIGTVTGVLGFSIENFMVAEIGRDRNSTERLVRALIGLRVVLLPVMLACVFAALAITKASPIVRLLTEVSLIGTCIGFLVGPTNSVLAGWEDAKRVASFSILSSLTPFLVIPFLHYGPLAIIIVGLICSLPVTILTVRSVSRHISLRPIFDTGIWKRLIVGSFGFYATDLVLQFYASGTIFALKHFTDEATIGVYSQANKLLGTFLFLPSALGMAMLPSLARLADASKSDFKRMQERVMVVMIVFGLPVATLAFMLATPLSQLLYTKHKFLALPIVLKACAFNVIPLYMTTIMYRFLVAERKNAIWSLFLLGTVILNGILCFVLVPITMRMPGVHSGAVGAVIACTIAEASTVIFAFILLRNNPINRYMVGRIACSFLATAGMAVVIWVTRDVFALFQQLFPGLPEAVKSGLTLLTRSALGVGTFIVCAWSLKVLGADDQRKLTEIVLRKLRRSKGSTA